MIDIVERIRKRADHDMDEQLLIDAADEIERLRHIYRDISPEQAEAIRRFKLSAEAFKQHYG